MLFSIGVHTSTGRVGRAVARALVERDDRVRILGPKDGAWRRFAAVHAERKAASLRSPPLHSVFLAPPRADAPADIERDLTLVLELLRLETSVRHVVLLSSIGAHALEGGPGLIARAGLFESGLAWAGLSTTFVRPAFFVENWRLPFAIAARSGFLPSIVGPIARPTPMVALDDVAEAVVGALLAPNEARDVLELEGPSRPSAHDVALHLGAVLGRTIRPIAVSDGVVERWVRSRYRDEGHAREWATMLGALRADTLAFENPRAVVRGPTSVADAVRRLCDH